MDDLRAAFLPRFAALAERRVASAFVVASGRDHGAAEATARELHSLAGEAGLLGFAALVPLARACEEKVRAMGALRTGEAADAFALALQALADAIAGVVAASA